MLLPDAISRYTSKTSDEIPAGPENLHHAYYSWMKGHCLASCMWWPTLICPHRDDPEWISRGLLRCPLLTLTLLSLPWHTYSLEWNHPLWRSHCCSIIKESRCCLCHTQRSPRHHKMSAVSLELCPLVVYEHGYSTIHWGLYNVPMALPQQFAQPLQLTPTPGCSWQIVLTGLFHFDKY